MTKILLGAALPALLAFGTIHSATAQTVSRIVFVGPVTVKNGHTSITSQQIFSMNPDGKGGVVQLTSANVPGVWPYSSPAWAYCPSWSPGQKYIAFSRNGTLYVMEAKGEVNGGRTFAVAPASVGGSAWSPDGAYLVYEGTSGNLYIVPVNADAGTAGNPVPFRLGSYSGPSWSSDGTRIAFWGSDDGNLPFFIHVRDVASGAEISFGVSVAGATIFSNGSPQWSPSPHGSLIAFSGPVSWTVTTRKGTSTNYGAEIFTANPNVTNPNATITRQTFLKSFTSSPTWSPDGTAIAFRSDVSGTASVYKMVLGSNVTTLLHSPGCTPDWNPSAPVWP
jgi:Tol biopolymer transport system component